VAFGIVPDEGELLAGVSRKHRGNGQFIANVEEGLAKLREDPLGSPRVIQIGEGMRRYRHGRCRIIFRVADNQVEVLKIDLRREGTYRDL
jgi:mRNA-degrading endonuclease RelE of RelBE toxin-antitoxin system